MQKRYDRMKRLLSIVLVLILSLTLVSCGSKKSSEDEQMKEVAGALMEKFKAFDIDGALEMMRDKEMYNLEARLDVLPSDFVEQIKTWASQMEYTVEDISVDDIKAFAKIHIKHVDATKVMEAASKEYLGFAQLQMGIDATTGYLNGPWGGDPTASGNIDDLVKNELSKCLNHAMETEELLTKEVDIDVEFVKYQGEWVLKGISKELFHAFTSNVFSLASDLK